MIRRLFRFLARLIVVTVLVFIATGVWIVLDGLFNHGEHADVAVVPGMAVLKSGEPGSVLQARLDGALKLYHEDKFPLIIVSGATYPNGYDEARSMAKYLETHGVPASAIIQDPTGINTAATAEAVGKIMKERHLHSAMIVTHYYHITRTKLALMHGGVEEIQQAHVGMVGREDGFLICREVVATYAYLAQYYVVPGFKFLEAKVRSEAPKAKEEIQKGVDKLKEEIHSAQR